MTENEWMDIFATNLEELVRDYGVSRRELAEDAGLTEAALCNYIRRRRAPNFRAIINLAHALDITVDELIDFGDDID